MCIYIYMFVCSYTQMRVCTCVCVCMPQCQCLVLCVCVSLKERRFGTWAIISSDLQPQGQQWNGKEQGSLLSQRCSLHLKGHVMFPGNWLDGFGFYSIRSGCFHSACVSWGMCLPVVFTLTSLPSPGHESGMDSPWLPPAQGCLAPTTPWLCPRSRVECGCLPLLGWSLPQQRPPACYWIRNGVWGCDAGCGDYFSYS